MACPMSHAGHAAGSGSGSGKTKTSAQDEIHTRLVPLHPSGWDYGLRGIEMVVLAAARQELLVGFDQSSGVESWQLVRVNPATGDREILAY